MSLHIVFGDVVEVSSIVHSVPRSNSPQVLGIQVHLAQCRSLDLLPIADLRPPFLIQGSVFALAFINSRGR